MHLLAGYHKPIVALALSPDGARLYSAARGQQMIWVWGLARREVERKLRGQHRKGVQALACSANGEWLLSAEENFGVAAWRLGDGGEGRLLPRDQSDWTSASPAVAIHPDSCLAAFPFWSFGDEEARHGIQLWGLPEGKRRKVIRGHVRAVTSVAFSPAGGLLASGSSDRTVKLWHHASGEEALSLTLKVVPSHLAFRPDGKALAVAGHKSVFVWGLPRGGLLHVLTGHGGVVAGLAYSPDGKYLASSAADGVVFLRDAQTHEVLGQRHLGLGGLGPLVWQPDSSGLVVGGEKLIALCEVGELLGTAQARKKEKGEPLSLAGHESRALGLAYSPDGQALCRWARDGVRIWDFSQGAGQACAKAAFVLKGHSAYEALTWSPDGRRLAASFRRGVHVYDAETGEVLHEIEAGTGPRRYLAFTPAGRLFLALIDRTSARASLQLRDAEGRPSSPGAWRWTPFPFA